MARFQSRDAEDRQGATAPLTGCLDRTEIAKLLKLATDEGPQQPYPADSSSERVNLGTHLSARQVPDPGIGTRTVSQTAHSSTTLPLRTVLIFMPIIHTGMLVVVSVAVA